jgi:hypothetical protein
MEHPTDMPSSDDVWIQKFRTALDSAPVRHSRIERLREIAYHARAVLALKGANMVERCVEYGVLKTHRIGWVRASASPQPNTPSRKLARPFLTGVVRSSGVDAGQD